VEKKKEKGSEFTMRGVNSQGGRKIREKDERPEEDDERRANGMRELAIERTSDWDNGSR
jgi:hypothetical protein